MSISVKNVTKLYGKQKAVDNISFEINTGEIVGFLGPNGAGKSTTMKIITSFIPQNNGEVLVSGINTLTNPIEVKKKVGYLPEHNPLYTDMYVKEYLTFLARLHKIKSPRNSVTEMINAVGLEKEQNKKIGALSKGYRQRVGLAQSILHDPDVLILDEPTSGLDPNQLVEIRELIKSFGKNKTVLLSTHIMQEVEAICDRVIIIKEGKIVADDQIKSIKEQKEKQVVTVTFEHNIEASSFEKNGILVTKKSDTVWTFSSSTNDDLRKDVAKIAQANKYLILEMSVEKNDLEAVFKKLTK